MSKPHTNERKLDLHNKGAEFSIPTFAVRIGLFVLRHEAKVTHIQQSKLQRRNERNKGLVVAPGGPVVSMTTYGGRLNTVHLALESIAAGSVLPSRLVLWVEEKDAYKTRSPGLKRLVDRGLEIHLSESFGPHTKYFPYLLSAESFDTPLVTGDDDLLYSRWWLEGLVRAYESHPLHLNCYRAHSVSLTDGDFAPYREWPQCLSSQPSYLHFPTGVSGCIYPKRLQEALKSEGKHFLETCPKADDVWIHVNALRAGIKVRQIRNHPLRFPLVPGTQGTGLYHSNVFENGNDAQIRRTYSKDDISILQEYMGDGSVDRSACD